jgi:hypothetical protein
LLSDVPVPFFLSILSCFDPVLLLLLKLLIGDELASVSTPLKSLRLLALGLGCRAVVRVLCGAPLELGEPLVLVFLLVLEHVLADQVPVELEVNAKGLDLVPLEVKPRLNLRSKGSACAWPRGLAR